MNGAPDQLRHGHVWTLRADWRVDGWLAPTEEAIAKGAQAISPTAFDWIGLALIAIVLPAVITPLLNMICRKLGWVKDGDLKLS